MDKALDGCIFDIQRFCLHDGPGLRTVVFLKGCPLRCLWCANPESQTKKPQLMYNPDSCIRCGICADECTLKAIQAGEFSTKRINRAACGACGRCVPNCPADALRISGRSVTPEEVLDEVKRDELIFKSSGGGVTFSGGEPYSQPDFIFELLRMCKRGGLDTAVETSGYTEAEAMRRADPYVDHYMFDIKHACKENHIQGTGVSNERILANLSMLMRIARDVTVRIPVIPGFNTDAHSMRGFLELFREHAIKKAELMPYHEYGLKKYEMLGCEYPGKSFNADLSRESVQALKDYLTGNGILVSVSGE
jgi:pyruvate formate lyase activating enzyme